MILRLLAIFPAVGRLLSDLEKSENQNLILQDRLALLENDRERLWDEAQKARAAETACYHMLVNIEYQRHYGIVPFPDDVKLPPAPNSGGSPSSRMTASQAVEAQIDRVVRDIQQKMAKQ